MFLPYHCFSLPLPCPFLPNCTLPPPSSMFLLPVPLLSSFPIHFLFLSPPYSLFFTFLLPFSPFPSSFFLLPPSLHPSPSYAFLAHSFIKLPPPAPPRERERERERQRETETERDRTRWTSLPFIPLPSSLGTPHSPHSPHSLTSVPPHSRLLLSPTLLLTSLLRFLGN